MYKSVDHYYQKMKVFDLTKDATNRFDDPKIKNYSGVAREILREKGVSVFSIAYHLKPNQLKDYSQNRR